MVLSTERWKGKVAIVTGASSGIGATIARKLVEEGLQVAGLARRSERVEELAKKLQGKKGKLHAIKTDMCNEEDILEAFKWVSGNLGPVHILINNAGIAQRTSISDGDTKKWRRVFDTNVIGLCIATREAVRMMRANRIDGHIVNINSVAGHAVLKILDFNIYSASKFAVTALTETLRQEWNHLGLKIKVTSVSPGAVTSEMAQTSELNFNEEEQEIVRNMPFLQTEDIADGVLYALSTPPHVQVHELTIKPLGEKH